VTSQRVLNFAVGYTSAFHNSHCIYSVTFREQFHHFLKLRS